MVKHESSPVSRSLNLHNSRHVAERPPTCPLAIRALPVHTDAKASCTSGKTQASVVWFGIPGKKIFAKLSITRGLKSEKGRWFDRCRKKSTEKARRRQERGREEIYSGAAMALRGSKTGPRLSRRAAQQFPRPTSFSMKDPGNREQKRTRGAAAQFLLGWPQSTPFQQAPADSLTGRGMPPPLHSSASMQTGRGQTTASFCSANG